MAISSGDWHLSDVPPPYREQEPDWFQAMLRPINEIKSLATKYKCPILHGGDIFDKAKVSPELVNWTLRNLPTLYAVPGNHDLPNHRYEDLHKSSFGTLVEAGKIVNIKPGIPHPVSDHISLYGFPWDSKVGPIASNNISGLNVALIHAYIWIKGKDYQGAPDDKRAGEWRKKLTGFDVACFSDNHKGFLTTKEGVKIANCGGLMRRKSDEANYEPRVYLIWSDGEVTEKKLDTSADICLAGKIAEVAQEGIDPTQLIESFRKLKNNRIDFMEIIGEMMMTLNVNKELRAKISEACETKCG